MDSISGPLEILKHQIKLFVNKVEESYKKDSKDKDDRNKYKLDLLETLEYEIKELKTAIEGKSTAAPTGQAMNDITALQLIGKITKEDLRQYAIKYKDYPMILKYLQQIGESNAYKLSFKSIDDANEIIKNLENDIVDFIENFDPSKINENYIDMTTDLDDNYFDRVAKDLNNFNKDKEITITIIE